MPEALEFLDCNARLGRPTVCRAEQITTKDELLAEMDYAGISRALVHHALASQWSPREGNSALLEALAGEDRLLPCFVGLPSATGELPAPEEFAATVRAHHGAVRLFPKEHQYVLEGWSMGDTFEALAADGVPVLLDVSQVTWGDLAAILAAHPRLNLLLLDTYYRVDRYLYPLLERHPNLHLETTTYQVHRGIEAVCARFGPERLVFGTNLPHLETGGPISQIVYSDLPPEARAALAGGNLKRLLGL